jgi:hypothetical protein
MNQDVRIELTDTPLSATMKLCGGNPGAMTVCIQILEQSERIDPDNLLGGLGCLLSLDSHSIYGPQIWMLYKDVCKEDITKTIAVLRSVQLGLLSEEKLHIAINNYGTGIDVEELYNKVKDTLPRFDIS